MQPLLELAVQALACALASGQRLHDVQRLPEPELALWLWEAVLEQQRRQPPPPSALRGRLLGAFVHWWRPQRLCLQYHPLQTLEGLGALGLVSSQLLHLELCAPGLWRLEPLVACTSLRCLSLRGCTSLPDAASKALPSLSSLRALDLGGLSQLGDGAVFHAAHLPALRALNLSHTAATDAALEMLTYGARARAWQQRSGLEQLPPQAAAWPVLPLHQLGLAGTRVGAAGVAQLGELQQLSFLDVRRTGVQRGALVPLQQRFGLQQVQGGVLSSSNALAAARINHEEVVCCCAAPPDPQTPVEQWGISGAQLLLHADAPLLPPLQQGLLPPAAPAGSPAQPLLVGGKRLGYREPRQLLGRRMGM